MLAKTSRSQMAVSDARAKIEPTALGKRPMSRWAVASFLLGLGICAPLSVAAIFCGIRSLMDMRHRPQLRGRPLAILGMIFGFIGIVATVLLGVWWNETVRRPMIDGPVAAIQAGQLGQIAEFKSWFTQPGASAPDQEVF